MRASQHYISSIYREVRNPGRMDKVTFLSRRRRTYTTNATPSHPSAVSSPLFQEDVVSVRANDVAVHLVLIRLFSTRRLVICTCQPIVLQAIRLYYSIRES